MGYILLEMDRIRDGGCRSYRAVVLQGYYSFLVLLVHGGFALHSLRRSLHMLKKYVNNITKKDWLFCPKINAKNNGVCSAIFGLKKESTF